MSMSYYIVNLDNGFYHFTSIENILINQTEYEFISLINKRTWN